MKRVLILQSDDEQAQNLSATIAAQGEAEVSLARTVREACLLVTQEAFDIVLVDDDEAEGARRALHALQPNLVLESLSLTDLGSENGMRLEGLFRFLFDDPDESTPQAGSESADETIVDAAPDARIEESFLDSRSQGSHAETLVHGVSEPQVGPQASADVDDQRHPLAGALDRAAKTERVVGCVLVSGNEHVASGGDLTQDQLQAIADKIGQTWRGGGTALIQFLRLPQPSAEFALYTRPAPQARSLTLVAAPDIDAGRLRRTADSVAEELDALSGAPAAHEAQEPQPVVTHTAMPEASARRSFALIFQPRRSLPRAMQDAVQDALHDVSSAASCTLLHLSVSAELVHMVTNCPGERGSGWVAQLFKQGVEQRIQDRFGVQAQLWRKGFYATESDQPLSDVELRLFLDE